jgi:hypothetical protein
MSPQFGGVYVTLNSFHCRRAFVVPSTTAENVARDNSGAVEARDSTSWWGFWDEVSRLFFFALSTSFTTGYGAVVPRWWVAQVATSAQVLVAGMHAAAVIGAATLSLNSVAESIVGEDIEQRRRAVSITGSLRPLGAFVPPPLPAAEPPFIAGAAAHGSAGGAVGARGGALAAVMGGCNDDDDDALL